MNIRELSQEELKEESFVDLAFALLEETHETKLFLEIVKEVEKLLGWTREDSTPKLGQFYTDMNIDGRFLILGENRWGLREWYPVEQIEEESAPTVKVRKKKKKVVEDDFDDVEELELEDELLEDDFVEEDDEEEDDEDDLAPAVKAEPLNFDEDDDEDEVDVDVLVEDMDGNIIDEEDEEEEDDLK